MKRFFVAFVSIVALLVFSSTGVSAQGSPCKPDCSNDNWSNPVSTVTLNVNGCSVTIKYRTRFACSTYYDVYLESFQLTGTNCAGSPPNWSVFIQQVTVALLLNNPMGFPPSVNSTCEDNWRVAKGSCWLADFLGGVGGEGGMSEALNELRPCSAVTCCLERYQVCLDAYGVRSVTFQGSAPEACPQGTPSYCFPACNAGGR